jgi:apolipoprotein D and lipocalin family protein
MQFLLVLYLLVPVPQSAEVRAVDSVDLDRYSGTWYEIARYPNRFQKSCSSDVTATYTVQGDGRIEVLNRCRKADDSFDSATGTARLADQSGPRSKLKVRFAPGFLSFLPFVWADYWIIDLAEDYSSAVVGTPDHKYLWILSRTPRMEDTVFESICRRIQQMGYEPEKLVRTAQSDAAGQ